MPRHAAAPPLLYPGTTCVVIGAGGLGHIGIQCLATLAATSIIVVDANPDALKLASEPGAAHTVVADGSQREAVAELLHSVGALDDLEVTGDYATGFGIVRRALSEPAYLIAANAGYPAADVVAQTAGMGLTTGLTPYRADMAT